MRQQRGFTIIEIAFALAIIGILTGAVMAPQIKNWYENQKNAVAASQIKIVGDAASKYIQDNYTALTSSATATQPVLITVPMLQSAGYLQSNVSVRNNLNQAMCVLVKQPVAGKLQALLVTEGGTALDDINLPAQAAQLGGAGGYVSNANITTIQGVGGGWTLPVSTFDNLNNDLGQRCDGTAGRVRIQPGHSVMALWFTSEDVTAGVLYRNAVPGKPELNRMNTSIDMNGQNLNNANVVQAATGNIQTINATTANVSGSLKAYRIGTMGYDPNNGYPPGWGGGIHTWDVYAEGTVAAGQNGNVAASLNKDGIVKANVVDLTKIVTPGTSCPVNGRVARDASGQLISCQNGRWSKPSASLTGGIKALLAPLEGQMIYAETQCQDSWGDGMIVKAYGLISGGKTYIKYHNGFVWLGWYNTDFISVYSGLLGDVAHVYLGVSGLKIECSPNYPKGGTFVMWN